MKKAGVVRVGILRPQIKLAEKDSADVASEIADAVVELFGEILKSPTVEMIEIASASDAKTLECDFILSTNITQKKGGGLLGKFIPPISGKGGMQNPNPQTFTRLQGLMISYVKAKDEWTFEYKATDASGLAIAQNSSKVKAEQYSEDVLTPQIKSAANAISGKIQK